MNNSLRFITDLSRGILGAPDSTELWTSIISHVPDDVLLRPGVKILNVACGHGTEADLLVQRMRALGISSDDINNSIYVLDKYNVFMNRMRRYGYKNAITADFLTWNTDMKFDVVIGNPPFKNGKETGGKSSLWRKIVAKSWPMVKDQGMLIMITPQFPNSAKDLGYIFIENQTNLVWTKISHYFPGVGSSFFAWAVTKVPKTTDTLFVNEGLRLHITSEALPNDLRSISIFQKIFSYPKFECKSSPEYFHTSVADGKDDDHLFSKSTKKHPYILRRTSGDTYQMYGAVKPTDYELPKVVMTFSGNPHYRFHGKNEPIGTIKFQSGHILVQDRAQGENLIRLYESTLYRYIQSQMTSGGMRGKNFYELPMMDLSRSWSDQELYDYFGLTQDEINLVTCGI
jgi:hypothetical protein